VSASIVALIVALAGLLATLRDDKQEEAARRVQAHLRELLNQAEKLDKTTLQ